MLTRAVKAVDTTGIPELLTRDHGKVLGESVKELAYLGYPVDFLGDHTGWLDHGEILGDNGAHRSTIYRDPFGVVGIISP